MRRAAIIFSVISVAVLILGIVEWATNFHWAQGDQNPLFGNPNILLNDGTTVLITAAFLFLGSGLMWILALRKGRGDQRDS